MSDLVVRPARENDLEAIGVMWERLVAYHQRLDDRLPPAQEDGARAYAHKLADRLDDPSMHVLVAEMNGQLVGYVLGMIVDLMGDLFAQDACGFLADIYVESAFRRAGAGRALVDALMAWFASQNVTYYEWHVAAQNTAGRAFWEAMQGETVLLRMRADVPDGRGA